MTPDRADLRLLWASVAWLALLAAIALITRPLIPLDETRYAAVAWEMWTRGDFLVPFKNGEPYSHKPPLLFWIVHAGWAVFGVNDWWPRLVSPLLAMASVVLTWRLGQRLWPDRDLGGRAAAILATSLLWMLFSTAFMFDVLLAFWVLLGALALLDARDGKRRGFVVLGVALGSGLLSKGPVVLLHLLPLAALAPLWHMSLRRTPWFAGVAGALILAAAIALAWALPAGTRGGDAYQGAIFWGQTADRMVESFAHRRPFWWYLPLLPVLLYPWFIWPAAWKGLLAQARAGLDPGMRFCLGWMLPVFVVFSLISGKQPHYLIPLFPVFALLLARGLGNRATSSVAWPAALAGVTGVLLVAAALDRIPALREAGLALPPLWPGVSLVLLATAAWIVGRARERGFVALAALGAGAFVLAHTAVMRSLAPGYDGEPMAKAIAALQAQGTEVANVARYHGQYHFLGRLDRPLVELGAGEWTGWAREHPQSYAVIYVSDARKLETVRARHTQRYRGGVAALVSASDAAKVLAAEAAK